MANVDRSNDTDDNVQKLASLTSRAMEMASKIDEPEYVFLTSDIPRRLPVSQRTVSFAAT